MIFTDTSKLNFAEHYPARPLVLDHQLETNELFALERLVELSKSLPQNRVEYSSGKVPVNQDPETTPENGLSIEETILSIEENGSWMVLKNIEHDATYKALLESCLGDLGAQIEAATGKRYRQEGFIFISSPNSVTPFHMDPEHNILMQIRGEKTMRVYPVNDPDILTPEMHEAYHTGGHRNMVHKDEFETKATAFHLTPGKALHVPVKAPHWVQNGDKTSISLSITWRSEQSDKEADIHLMNSILRKKGMAPGRTGNHPLRDNAKAFGYKVLRKLSR